VLYGKQHFFCQEMRQQQQQQQQKVALRHSDLKNKELAMSPSMT